MRFINILFLALLGLVVIPFQTLAAPSKDKVRTIYMYGRYDIEGRQPRIMVDFFKNHPEIRLRPWTGINLPVGGDSASLAMAMAANNGPDIFELDIRQSVKQGMAYPLTEWIGRDGILKNGKPKLNAQGKPDLNGQVDADEAKWDGWMKIKPLFRQVVTVDGVPSALPHSNGTYVGLLYSKRMFKKAGLNPMNPPANWDEFVFWCRKLYDHKTKTPSVDVYSASWAFAPWVAAAGDSIVVQERKSPKTGKVYTFHEQATSFVAPDTGEDLATAVPKWKVNVGGKGCIAAVGLLHRLRWAPWIQDKTTGDPVELSKNDVENEFTYYKGRRITFSKDDVIEGCISCSPYGLDDTISRFGRQLAMFPLWCNDMTEFETKGIPPEDLGFLAFPPIDSKHRPVLQASQYFNMIGKDAKLRGGDTAAEKKQYLNTVWEILRNTNGVEVSDDDICKKVAAGRARFMNPRDLKRLKFNDYIKEIPPEDMKLWNQISGGKILEVVEPYMGSWLQFRQFLQMDVLDLVLKSSGKNFDYAKALKQLEHDGNAGTMFAQPKSTLDKHRPVATVVAAFVGLLVIVFAVLIILDQRKAFPSHAGVYKGWLPWAMLIPAVISIALWGYYPLMRGMVMAFQDYKIVGKSQMVGLDNFISIALDPNFYHYMITTCRFVMWNFGLAFFTPIFLALLLTEIPKLKVFFRTLFFLPQMTSGIVVALMWKEMFGATSSGTINRIFSFLLGHWFTKPIDWLGDPRTVMACVIIPVVWAGSGIGSLIYLAALKSVPEELYEAASLDGAGILKKIWKISLPTLLPLIIINFIGTFIGTFQSMGSIFLLTFGGPGKATMVMSMAIWQEAYVNLRFSLATSYAWILGSLLLGFTYMQMRMLRRMEFKQAKGD